MLHFPNPKWSVRKGVALLQGVKGGSHQAVSNQHEMAKSIDLNKKKPPPLWIFFFSFRFPDSPEIHRILCARQPGFFFSKNRLGRLEVSNDFHRGITLDFNVLFLIYTWNLHIQETCPMTSCIPG